MAIASAISYGSLPRPLLGNMLNILSRLHHNANRMRFIFADFSLSTSEFLHPEWSPYWPYVNVSILHLQHGSCVVKQLSLCWKLGLVFCMELGVATKRPFEQTLQRCNQANRAYHPFVLQHLPLQVRGTPNFWLRQTYSTSVTYLSRQYSKNISLGAREYEYVIYVYFAERNYW